MGHERVCPFAPSPCPYNKYGCKFTGSEELIKKHVEMTCKWADIKEYIAYNEEQMGFLRELIEKQQKEIEELKVRLERGGETMGVSSKSTGSIHGEDKSHVAECHEAEHWSLKEIMCKNTLYGHTRGVTSLAYYAEEGIIYSGSHDGSIRAWNEETGECFRTVDAHSTTIWGLATDPSTGILYSGGSDGKIKSWNFSLGGDEKAMDVGQEKEASIGKDMESMVCNGKTPEQSTRSQFYVDTLASHTGRIYDIMFHKQCIFSASVDRTINIWDANSHECLHTFRGHTDGVNAICMSGEHLASASSDKTIKIWDLERGECVATIEDNSSDVLALCVGPNYLFSATQSADVKVYDRKEYRLRHRLSGHRWEVRFVFLVWKRLKLGFGLNVFSFSIRNRSGS